jgi:very-short-patch-repair endonuclease
MPEGQVREKTMIKIKTRLSEENLRNIRNLRKNSTPQEIVLWSRLKNNNFKNLKFRRQYNIGKYIADFICLERKLIIELDGWQHKEENQERYDQERTKYLERQGFKVIRFWNNEINNNLTGVFLKIEEFI